MNVRLLRKVKKHILAEPKRLVMDYFIKRTEEAGPTFLADDKVKEIKFAKCGTAACIAGWACVLSGKRESSDPETEGRKLLGLDGEEAERLFYTKPSKFEREGSWPMELGERYYSAKTQKTRAKIAAERIEHFIKTKGAE